MAPLVSQAATKIALKTAQIGRFCVYEVYENMRYDAETIAKFYQLSVHSDVKGLFPHIYKYHQEVVVSAAEEYYLNNTKQCPKAFDLYEYGESFF